MCRVWGTVDNVANHNNYLQTLQCRDQFLYREDCNEVILVEPPISWIAAKSSRSRAVHIQRGPNQEVNEP